MNINIVISLDDDKLNFEQTILKKLYQAVDNIGTSSIIGNLDAKYFAENIKYMLNNWDNEVVSEANVNLRLDVVKLVNVKKYSNVYFVMMESGKYPRKFKEQFPYTKQIIEILTKRQYGINTVPINNFALSLHLNIEKYHFINVLDFTNNKLVITMCYNEFGDKNMPSIFVDDIESIFECQNNRKDNSIKYEKSLIKFNKPIGNYYLNNEGQYNLRDLLQFKLCPKLYFYNQNHSLYYKNRFQLQFYFYALLLCETLNIFKQYSRA